MHPVNPIHESQSNVTPASSVGSSNSASKSEAVPGNSSQEALNQLVSSMDQLTPQSVKAFLNDYEFGFNLHNDALGLNIVLSLSDISLGDIISEVLVSLRSIFNISDAQIDIQLVSLISRVSQMASSDKLTDIQIQDFKLALKELSTHSNQTLRNLANKFLKSGSIGSSQSTQPSDASSNFHAEMLALQSKASEPFSEQVLPTTAAPLSSGQSDMALFDATLQSNGKVITAGKGSIVVDASQSMAGIHATTSGASAHLSAILDSKQNVHQVGVVDLNGIPIMVMTPFVAALITSYVSKQLQEQRLKVAIVCDSVACLDGMERVDSIYLVDASKDLSSQSFVSIYNDLIDQGYRRILSIHVSPLLDKTYRLAKEASEHIEDIDVKVVNSHANGLGLGILIREVKEGIDHQYSAIELGQLIKKSILRMKHWWIPFAFNYSKSAAWIERTMDNRARMKLKMLNFKPVITLSQDKLRLADAFFDEERALRYVIGKVKQTYDIARPKLLHIGVEYRGQLAYRQALDLKNKLQAACPKTVVTLHTAGSVTVSRLGTELIGVCVI